MAEPVVAGFTMAELASSGFPVAELVDSGFARAELACHPSAMERTAGRAGSPQIEPYRTIGPWGAQSSNGVDVGARVAVFWAPQPFAQSS